MTWPLAPDTFMLHRSNAEDTLWKGRRSRAEAAGKSRQVVRRCRGAATWPRAVKPPRTECSAGPGYLLKTLR